MTKNIFKIEFTRDDLCNLIMLITKLGSIGGLSKEEKKVAKKLTKALEKDYTKR